MICKNENLENILETKGHKLSKCLSCNIIFSHKDKQEFKNSTEIYSKYYQEEKANRFGFAVEFVVKIFRFIRACKVSLLNPKAKSVLDIGSGRGWMLYFLKKYFKYDVSIGTQISENAFKFSKEKLKLEIYNKDLLELSLNPRFDVITIWHVLEHVETVELYIEKIHELLEEEGTLIVEVPNFNSWTSILTKEYWLALDLKHHLVFFTPSSLTSLLLKYNFEIKKIRTFSLEYSTFTSTQSLVNWITGTDSYFFEWLQNKNFDPKIIWHTFLFAILFLPCFLINLCLYFSKYGEVIHIIAKKRKYDK
ncbi:methyltransferase domain-containing protein [Candidatus Nomurabacteria bacterium]|nr:methyltransferase domain-containing protein [Candidatus Nomurabacteria bacterium]